MVNRRPQLKLIAPSASPQEAAAIVAALERFMRETAPETAPPGSRHDPWQRAAMLESVGGGADGDGVTPWGDPHPWG